jgi:diadenosine tetraphosphate (Ap4A) HIT family hydrolase
LSRTCDFCDELVGGSNNTYTSRYLRCSRTRTILETELFRVFPSLGQISEGHILIIPVDHVSALADLAYDELRHLEGLMLRVRSALRDIYGECILFEHGIRGNESGGCGIDHAHMHAVPALAKGVLQILERQFGGTKIESFEHVRQYVPEGSSYLFFETPSGARYTFAVRNLPSQYMRKLVTQSIGKTKWDWRTCDYEPELISTIARLSPLLSQPSAHRE